MRIDLQAGWANAISWGQLTVATLKGWLSGRGLNPGGRKPELIERVEGILERG